MLFTIGVIVKRFSKYLMMDLPTKLAAKIPKKYNAMKVRMSPKKVMINSAGDVFGMVTPKKYSVFLTTGESMPPIKPKRNFMTTKVT